MPLSAANAEMGIHPSATYPAIMIQADQRRIGPLPVMRVDPSAPGRRKHDGFGLNVRFSHGSFDKQTPQKIHSVSTPNKGTAADIISARPVSRSQFPGMRILAVARHPDRVLKACDRGKLLAARARSRKPPYLSSY